MPTDLSNPIWACDICKHRFGANLAAAERCEAAGPPKTLPDGELILLHDESRYVGTQHGWRIGVLHPRPEIRTKATGWDPVTAGHLATYDIEGRTYEGRPAVTGADGLYPHQAGFLQVITGHASGLGRNPQLRGSHGDITGRFLTMAGLTPDTEQIHNVSRDVHHVWRVRPITPEVRAVLDMLKAHLSTNQWRSWRVTEDAIAAAAAIHTSHRDGLPEGSYSRNRAEWWLAQMPLTPLDRAGAASRQAWWEGYPVTAPLPYLESHRTTTGGHGISASKLRKPERELIAATGVEWPARTSATEYLNLLIRKTLGIEMTELAETKTCFGTARTVIPVDSGKGGVGKSTTAAALAIALANRGESVLLLDLNLPNPGQHTLFRLGAPRTDSATRLILPEVIPTSAGRLAVFSHGQFAAATGDPAGTVLESGEIGDWLSFLDGALDTCGVTVVVLDMPPGWDTIHRHVYTSHVVNVTGVVYVTTGHPLAVENETLNPGRTSLNTKLPRWLIENLSRARGPVIGTTPGETAEIRLYGTDPDAVRELAEREHAVYAGSLPWEPDPARLAAAPEVAALAETITTRF